MRRNLMILAAALLPTVALATDPYCPPKPHCTYKQVTTYVTKYVCQTKQVPYTKEVTKYDHCGKPYAVCVTCYKDVQVEVPVQVPVTKWVKVCD